MESGRFRSMVKLTPTRFIDAPTDCKLHIGHIAPGVWQTVVEQDGQMAQTGPQSKTKMEAFLVLPEVAKMWGIEA